MKRLVLWGHHLDEYRDMFDLPQAALGMRFLEFQSGVSAFQADLRSQAAHLVSYDTWFGLSQADGRYLFAAQTILPFADFFFDYALSAHHFFSATAPQSVDYHIETIEELARAAKEVRIFPLVDAQGVPSELLGPVILALQCKNHGIEVRNVAYHLQPRGNAMLRIWAQQCSV